jgi:hypothetical protein
MKRRDFLKGLAAAAALTVVSPEIVLPERRYWQLDQTHLSATNEQDLFVCQAEAERGIIMVTHPPPFGVGGVMDMAIDPGTPDEEMIVGSWYPLGRELQTVHNYPQRFARIHNFSTEVSDYPVVMGRGTAWLDMESAMQKKYVQEFVDRKKLFASAMANMQEALDRYGS